jgi:trk system potassium uptake protein TrkA
MRIIVVGCGRVGSDLAYRFFQSGHQVTIVDQHAMAFERLHVDFRGRTVEGEVLSQDVLQRAGIGEAEGLVAVTNSDAVNAVVAHVAKTVYKVPNVVVRNYDPRSMPMHEAFGFQVVSSTRWGAQRVEELLQHGFVRTVFSAGNGEVEVYELHVPESWRGRPLADLSPGNRCIVVAVTRAGTAMLPSDDVRLETGDVVHLSATREGIEDLWRRVAAVATGG